MNKIRIMVVEDDAVFAKSIASFINRHPDMVVVALAASREESIEFANSMEIDVILMDINLYGNKYDGIFAALDILSFSKTKVIMLTSYNNQKTIIDSFTVGAANYILKENYTDLPNAIRCAYQDTAPLEVLLKEFCRLKEDEILKPLTPSEKEIFHLLERGLSKSQIERELYKTKNTVKTQVKTILRKLGVRDSKEAIKKVRSKGLLES